MRYFVAILKFAITRKNGAKIGNTRLAKTFVAIFVLAERLPTSATLVNSANAISSESNVSGFSSS